MRTTRLHAATLALASVIAIAAPATAALAGDSQLARAPDGAAAKVKSGVLVLITKHTVVPKVQRTVHFTGYASYSFSAPRGRRIVSASARILGAQAHAVAIRSRVLSHNRRRYTVKLVFPGEQGNPGRLLVTLGSVA